jgi:hypothetical protein
MSKKVVDILDENKHDDLQDFLNRRKYLNKTNMYLIYVFHFVQSTGLLITSYATSVNNTTLVWVGISLNAFASLLNVYEKVNSNILKKLLNEINLIKDGKYVDEDVITKPENYKTF